MENIKTIQKILRIFKNWGTRWSSGYAKNRQVAGSILDGVIGIFQWQNPSGHTMALGSTQLLTEMSTRFTSWG